jgi:hypothetical protein
MNGLSGEGKILDFHFCSYPPTRPTIELTKDALIIRNVDYIINEMNAIFTKNQTVKKENIVEDFIEDC